MTTLITAAKETKQSPVILYLRLRKTRLGKSQIPSVVFEKLCFRDGLVWTVGLTGEIRRVFKFLRPLLWPPSQPLFGM